DEARSEIAVDAHLLAWHGVEPETGRDLRDARGAFRDHDELDDDDHAEDDHADDRVIARDDSTERENDVPGRVLALRGVSEDEPSRRDVERQAKERRDE